MNAIVRLVLGLILAGPSTFAAAATAPPTVGNYLFIWASDVGAKASDFLAVLDANPKSDLYGEVIATVPVGVANSVAHHTEHVMPAGGMLFANGFGAGQTFIFDLKEPRHPRLAGAFGSAGEFMHPHSFARTPGGTVLATYQMRGHDNAEPGALVELDPMGNVLRVAPAADPQAEPFIRPYSLVVVPALDRVVTTSADMHALEVSHSVQVWRLSDLTLIKSVRLPQGPRGNEGNDPAEPRLLADGRTVVISSFNCGLFLLNGLEGSSPEAEHIFSIGTDGECALPVVTGDYWVATDTSIPGLVSLDLSDPRNPREVSRLTLGEGELPHWISLAPDGERIVISGGGGNLQTRVLMARIDRQSGQLTLDGRFRDREATQAGVSFDRPSWPHGDSGRAIPHGAVFSRDETND